MFLANINIYNKTPNYIFNFDNSDEVKLAFSGQARGAPSLSNISLFPFLTIILTMGEAFTSVPV